MALWFDSLNLTIPDYIQKDDKPFLGFSMNQFPVWGSSYFNEIFLNVLLFIPLGFFLHAIIDSYRYGNRWTIFL
jgi:hypothetical protein